MFFYRLQMSCSIKDAYPINKVFIFLYFFEKHFFPVSMKLVPRMIFRCHARIQFATDNMFCNTFHEILPNKDKRNFQEQKIDVFKRENPHSINQVLFCHISMFPIIRQVSIVDFISLIDELHIYICVQYFRFLGEVSHYILQLFLKLIRLRMIYFIQIYLRYRRIHL